MAQRRLALLLTAMLSLGAMAAMSQEMRPILHDTFDEGDGLTLAPGREGRALLARPGERFGKEIALPAGAQSAQGAMMFWVQPQRELRNAPEAVRLGLVVSEGAQAFLVELVVRSTVQLRFTIRPANDAPRSASFDFTHLKPKKWYFFAVAWDAAKGAMDLYFAGQRYTHIECRPWTMPDLGVRLRVGAPDVAMDNFRIYDRSPNGEEIVHEAALRPDEAPADEGIQVYPETDADYPVKTKLLYETSFDGGLGDWVLEGPGVTEIRDGRLYMESREPQNGHIVLWNKRDFPADFLAEWDFSPANESALYIVFFCARGRDGKDLFDPSLAKRDGTFTQYTMGDINAYHISYFRNLGRESGICNLRKEHGFYLVSIGRDPMAPVAGGKHRIRLLKRGPQIRFFIDGKLCVKFDDDGKTYGPVWGAGKIGLRQMAPSKAFYDMFRVYELME